LIIEPDAGREPLLSAIKNAKSSIYLVMYGLTDSHFTNALIKAKQQGKKVRILLEPHPYKNQNENHRTIQQLQAENIALQWPSTAFTLTHQKTFLIDQHSAIVMTFNLTKSAFAHQRNFALILTDPHIIEEIERVFSADWTHTITTVKNADLIWSPNNSREKINLFINTAKSEIKLYAPNMSDYNMIGLLAKKSRSGIQVDILTSANTHNKKFAYLKKAGIHIHHSKHYIIHAKVIMVDQKRALLGSINLTKPSIDDNRELSVITEDPDVIKQLTATFVRDLG